MQCTVDALTSDLKRQIHGKFPADNAKKLILKTSGGSPSLSQLMTYSKNNPVISSTLAGKLMDTVHISGELNSNNDVKSTVSWSQRSGPLTTSIRAGVLVPFGEVTFEKSPAISLDQTDANISASCANVGLNLAKKLRDNRMHIDLTTGHSLNGLTLSAGLKSNFNATMNQWEPEKAVLKLGGKCEARSGELLLEVQDFAKEDKQVILGLLSKLENDKFTGIPHTVAVTTAFKSNDIKNSLGTLALEFKVSPEVEINTKFDTNRSLNLALNLKLSEHIHTQFSTKQNLNQPFNENFSAQMTFSG